MNKFIKQISVLILFLLISNSTFAQFGESKFAPISVHQKLNLKPNKEHVIAIDKSEIEEITNSSDHKGPYQVAVKYDVGLSFNEFELKHILPTGEKLYQLEITAEDALGMMIKLDNIDFKNGEKLWVINPETQQYIGQYSYKDVNREDYFLTTIISGEKLIIEFLEPKDVVSSDFLVSEIQYFFKGVNASGFGESGNCMINVACSEGDNFIDAINATCRIIIPTRTGTFFCTGTLLNNTANDGTPMVLTANHCSQNSFVEELKDWEFHFFYNSTTCQNPLIEPGNINFKGSKALAYSGSDNGEFSSDFLLVQLLVQSASTREFTFLGWDKSGNATLSGASVHHPAGDIKKISTFSTLPLPASYKNNVSGTHFEVTWSRTTNGHSVTEGGSSGGGLINSRGELIGTLTGGAATCNQKFTPDYYGRLSRHWNSYGKEADRRVDVWLDHKSTGASSVSQLKSVMKPNDIVAGIASEESIVNTIFVKYFDNKLLVETEKGNYFIKIFDLLGNVIYSADNLKKYHTINTDLYQSGIYIATIFSEGDNMSYKFHKR